MRTVRLSPVFQENQIHKTKEHAASCKVSMNEVLRGSMIQEIGHDF